MLKSSGKILWVVGDNLLHYQKMFSYKKYILYITLSITDFMILDNFSL